MPIGYSRDEVFSIPCPLDPAILLKIRPISVAESRKLRSLIQDASSGTKNAEEENALLNQAIKIGIIGWENCPCPFTDEGLDDALSTQQKYDLAQVYPSLLFISELEKKASRSRLPSNAAGSASAAAVVAATTSPTNTTPPSSPAPIAAGTDAPAAP